MEENGEIIQETQAPNSNNHSNICDDKDIPKTDGGVVFSTQFFDGSEHHKRSTLRHIADASPNDIDLLADDISIASAQSGAKRAWMILKISYIISGPLLIVGLALLIMGILKYPPTLDLLPSGIAIFVFAFLVFAGSTLLLCLYKAKKIKLFEFDDEDGTVNDGLNGEGHVGYAQGEVIFTPSTAVEHDAN